MAVGLLLAMVLWVGLRARANPDDPQQAVTKSSGAVKSTRAELEPGKGRATDSPGSASQSPRSNGAGLSSHTPTTSANGSAADKSGASEAKTTAASESDSHPPLLQEFWHNFTHNLFKPLLLFFYLGFLVPILRVKFEFPYAIYQGLTIYLLLAIGWRGGEELAAMDSKILGGVVGLMAVGFATNSVIGVLAYIGLSAMTRMRRVNKATIAGYYGSDSAGTFVTCLGVLTAAHIAFDAYMPVMLAVMEIPGCLVALYLVSRLRRHGMDPAGTMPDEPGYDLNAEAPLAAGVDNGNNHDEHPAHAPKIAKALEEERELSLEKRLLPTHYGRAPVGGLNLKLLHEVFLSPGLYFLFGGIVIGFISGLHAPRGHARRRQLLCNSLPGRPVPVLAGDGDDGITEAPGPEDGWHGLYRIRADRAQHLRQLGHLRRPSLCRVDTYSL